MSDPKILYSYQSPNHKQKWVRLDQTIANFQPNLEEAVALLYSSRKLHILQIQDHSLKYANGDLFKDWSEIFEARIFNYKCELRWLNRKFTCGQVVFLSEDKITAPNGFASNPIEYQECLLQQYLLWGKVVPKAHNLQHGWQRLTEARIGKIDVPVQGEVKKDKRVYLKTCEYIATIDEYDNMGVIEERLVKLEV